MASTQFEVVYVDKTTSPMDSAAIQRNLKEIFGLNLSTLERISTGEPVVIKRKLDFEEASRYQAAVKRAGGIAWVQELDENGMHQERRQKSRRNKLDRRAIYRASSVQPDRRQSCGRRSSDQHARH